MNLDTTVAVSAIVTCAATVAAAVVAILTLAGARGDSRARTRPVVVATLERELLSHGTLNLVIRNYGATLASDLIVRFDPPLPPPSGLPDADVRKWISESFAGPRQLAPHQSISNVYRAGHDDVAPIVVKLTYKAEDGHRYHQHFHLDPRPLLKTTQATPSDSNDKELRLIKAVEALVRAARER